MKWTAVGPAAALGSQPFDRQARGQNFQLTLSLCFFSLSVLFCLLCLSECRCGFFWLCGSEIQQKVHAADTKKLSLIFPFYFLFLSFLFMGFVVWCRWR